MNDIDDDKTHKTVRAIKVTSENQCDESRHHIDLDENDKCVGKSKNCDRSGNHLSVVIYANDSDIHAGTSSSGGNSVHSNGDDKKRHCLSLPIYFDQVSVI